MYGIGDLPLKLRRAAIAYAVEHGGQGSLQQQHTGCVLDFSLGCNRLLHRETAADLHFVQIKLCFKGQRAVWHFDDF